MQPLVKKSDKLTVLYIDDNPLDLQIVLDNLSDEFEVLFGTNANEAMFHAKTTPQPDIILLDIIMPNVDGFALCQMLAFNERTKDIPIIFISSSNSISAKTRGFNLGCVDYVTKPVDIDELSMRLKIHTKLSRQSEEIENLPGLNPITNLNNFNHYVNEINKEWATCKRYDYPLSLIHCKLDNADDILTEYGPYTLEKAIQSTANAIRYIGNRPGDFVAHIEDDYFAILLSDSHVSYAVDICKELVARVQNTPVITNVKESSIKISLSVGVCSVYPDEMNNAEHLHQSAIEALKEAEGLGGNTWSMYNKYQKAVIS